MASLSYRQRLFIDYYLGDARGNAAEAARMAGYRWPEKQGPRLVEKSRVSAAIAARLESSAMHSKEVLGRLSDIASGDLGDFIDIGASGGFTVNLDKARRLGKTHLIKRVKNRRETRFEPGKDGKPREPVVTDQIEIELHDPLAALDKLARFHGLFKNKEESKGTMHVHVTYEDHEPDYLTRDSPPPDRRQLPGPSGDGEDDREG